MAVKHLQDSKDTMTTIAGRQKPQDLAVNEPSINSDVPGLLDLAVEAHGGLARWIEVSSVKIDVSIAGAIWYVKGQPDVLKDIVMVADTQRERVHDVVRRPRSNDLLRA